MARFGGAMTKIAIPSADLALGLRSLSELLEAGMPLRRALTALEASSPDSWQPVHAPLQQAIREGRALSAGLLEVAEGFPPIVLGILRAGESGAGLPQAVRAAAEHADRAAATAAAMRAALAYPLLLSVAGIATAGFIGGVILPRFALLLTGVQSTLPWSTRTVLALADLARAAWIPVVAVTVLAGLVLRRILHSPDGRRGMDRLLLRVPYLGEARHAAAVARFADALSALLAGGMSLRSALPHAAAAVADEELTARLLQARGAILQGTGIARAFAESAALTPMAQKLVSAGEESGRLVELLAHIGRVEGARAVRLVNSAIRLIEPTLIIGIAIAIGLVATAMLQAVYAVRPS